jgi:hypothetical protein
MFYQKIERALRTGSAAGLDEEENVGAGQLEEVDAGEVLPVGGGVQGGNAHEVSDEIGHGGLGERSLSELDVLREEGQVGLTGSVTLKKNVKKNT